MLSTNFIGESIIVWCYFITNLIETRDEILMGPTTSEVLILTAKKQLYKGIG
jgi:hypothetical protein